jgi:hypothetical protein
MRKTYLKLLALGMAGGLAFCGTTARATLEISATVQINAVTDFDAPLAAEGSWGTVGSYGRCWHPRGVAADWRPYCDGQWVWTDNGWYWQSDEAWAWACYHYGTWTLDPTLGWIWVPGIEWAPAWVVWRSGGGYTGWAPCAPHGARVSSDWFAFVDTAHMSDRVRPASLVFKNQDIFGKTKSVKAATHETRNVGGRSVKAVVNKGPGVAELQKASGHEVKPVSVQEAHGRTRIPDTVLHKTPAARPAESAEPAHGEPRPGGEPGKGKEEKP